MTEFVTTSGETGSELGPAGMRPAVLAELEQQLSDVASGRGGAGVLISGPSRSGRTALLAELAAAAAARHRNPVIGAGFGSATPSQPWQALVDAFAAAAAELVHRRPGTLEVRAFDDAAAEFRAGGAERPDPAEVGRLTRMLGEAAEEARSVVLLTAATVPTDQAALRVLAGMGRAFDPAHPLFVVIATLPLPGLPARWSDRPLGPLSIDEVRALAPANARLDAVTRLVVRTGGWPALLRPALDELAQHGAESWTLEGVDRLVAELSRATVTRWAGGPLSSPERRYLRAVADLAGPDGSSSLAAVGRALGDTTRFSTESSTLAAIRSALIERGVLFSPSEDAIQPALAGFTFLLD